MSQIKSLEETFGKEHVATIALREELQKLEQNKPPLTPKAAERKAQQLSKKLERVKAEVEETKLQTQQLQERQKELDAQAAELQAEIDEVNKHKVANREVVEPLESDESLLVALGLPKSVLDQEAVAAEGGKLAAIKDLV